MFFIPLDGPEVSRYLIEIIVSIKHHNSILALLAIIGTETTKRRDCTEKICSGRSYRGVPNHLQWVQLAPMQ